MTINKLQLSCWLLLHRWNSCRDIRPESQWFIVIQSIMLAEHSGLVVSMLDWKSRGSGLKSQLRDGKTLELCFLQSQQLESSQNKITLKKTIAYLCCPSLCMKWNSNRFLCPERLPDSWKFIWKNRHYIDRKICLLSCTLGVHIFNRSLEPFTCLS